MLLKIPSLTGYWVGSPCNLTDTPLAHTSTMDSAVYGHYETGNYVRSHVFLDDKEYGRALDTIVKGLYPQQVYSKMNEIWPFADWQS